MATYASQIGTTISRRTSDEPSFKEAYAEHRAKWLKGEAPSTFTWNDKKYSVATREEAARQKEMMESPMRGRGYGQRAEGRAEIPTGGADKAPAERPRASLSDIPGLLARGMAGGAERVPSGRGLGAAFTGAGAAYRGLKAAEAVSAAREAARRAAAAEERMEPMLERLPELGRGFRSRTADRMDEREMEFRHGGKTKSYAKGGSVKGSGCEQRGLRKCKVY